MFGSPMSDQYGSVQIGNVPEPSLFSDGRIGLGGGHMFKTSPLGGYTL